MLARMCTNCVTSQHEFLAASNMKIPCGLVLSGGRDQYCPHSSSGLLKERGPICVSKMVSISRGLLLNLYGNHKLANTVLLMLTIVYFECQCLSPPLVLAVLLSLGSKSYYQATGILLATGNYDSWKFFIVHYSAQLFSMLPAPANDHVPQQQYLVSPGLVSQSYT